MDPHRKPRFDCALKALPEERQSDIQQHSISHSIAETADWLRANGIQVAPSQVSRFLSWYRLRRDLTDNDIALDELVHDPANNSLPSDTLYQAGNTFFARLAIAKQDPKTWFLAQQLNIRKARVDLATQKYEDERADIAAQKPQPQPSGGTGLAPETVKKVENELNI